MAAVEQTSELEFRNSWNTILDINKSETPIIMKPNEIRGSTSLLVISGAGIKKINKIDFTLGKYIVK